MNLWSKKWLLKTFTLSFQFIYTILLVFIPFTAIATEEKSNSNESETLQTEITQRDIRIIEQLTTIAQRKSAQVQETKAAMGLGAFVDIVTIELSPSQTRTNYTSPGSSPENERSFSLTVTVDPIKLLSTFRKQPLMQARWHEAKHQKRVAVVQYYLAYIQARQSAKIASYRMQKFTSSSPIASLHSQTISLGNINHLANPDYVAVSTEMLNTSARERLALEELAACVGISPQAIIALINGSGIKL